MHLVKLRFLNKKTRCWISDFKRALEILNATSAKDFESIKANYFKLAKINHPDAKTGSGEKFIQIHLAYNFLQKEYLKEPKGFLRRLMGREEETVINLQEPLRSSQSEFEQNFFHFLIDFKEVYSKIFGKEFTQDFSGFVYAEEDQRQRFLSSVEAIAHKHHLTLQDVIYHFPSINQQIKPQQEDALEALSKQIILGIIVVVLLGLFFI